MVLGSSSVRDDDFARKTSPSGQFSHQRHLCALAQAATLEDMAMSGLRRFPARDQTFQITGIEAGDTAIFC